MSCRSNPQNADEATVKSNQEWLLYHGIKNLFRCDQSDTVHGIAHYVLSQYRILQRGSDFMERRRQTSIPAVAAFLGAVTRFLEIQPGQQSNGVVWVARLNNERRVLEALPALTPDLDWTELKFQRLPNGAGISALTRKLLPNRSRIIRLARTLLRGHHEYFQILRAVELIGYYARYLDIFQQKHFKLAVMSSHSNPHGIAFNLAARKSRVPTVLVTHGMPVPPIARLSYDLAVVHCEAARQMYLEAGCSIKQVIIHGRRQDYAPMPVSLGNKPLKVGIFLCKDVNAQRLQTAVENLLADPRVSEILIRPHPKNIWLGLESWLAAHKSGRILQSSGGSAVHDIGSSDVVFAGNSSVLIEAVTSGRPSGYLSGLDYGSPDLHEFVRRGLIYPINEIDFNPDAMLSFYQRDEWSSILRIFANIDEDEIAVAARISVALNKLSVLRR